MVVGCNAIFGVDELKMADPPEQGGAAPIAASTASSVAQSTAAAGGADDCDTCARGANGCDAERAACAANPDCIPLDECLDLCRDSICVNGCLEMWEKGIQELYAQYDCERCSGPCKDVCQCDACHATDCADCVRSGCVQTACHELWNACVASSDCVNLVACVDGCNAVPSCEDACVNMHPSGAIILEDLLRCARCSWDTCYEVCDGQTICAT
jgi:hypothetical protein